MGRNKNRNPNQNRNKKSSEKYFGNTDVDSLSKQLKRIGLVVKEMLGDGNCLFRALGDQLEGHSKNHIQLRLKVVEYIKSNREDFEPFIEDDVPFDEHVKCLSEPGTYGGNDAIVAFSRLYNVCVVIHQYDSPAWMIYPTEVQEKLPNMKELHISYHNGDHYNSVVKLPDGEVAAVQLVSSHSKDADKNRSKAVKIGPSSKLTPKSHIQQEIRVPPVTHVVDSSGDLNDQENITTGTEKGDKSATPGKSKLSRRQKLDLKKKERKADSLQRKRGSVSDTLINDVKNISISEVTLKILTI